MSNKKSTSSHSTPARILALILSVLVASGVLTVILSLLLKPFT